jgi:uncharacterized protein (DUF924 family)
MDEKITEILDFWFEAPPSEEGEEANPTALPVWEARWFGRSSRVDREVTKRFGRLVEKARDGNLDHWAGTAQGRLALILLLDQFPRNIHHESPDAFTSDEKALALCYDGLDEEMDKELTIPQRGFFYRPCLHAEDVDAQLAGFEVYTELHETAPPPQRDLTAKFLAEMVKYREVVERFERLPHRNAILGRNSTSEESAYLTQTQEELL